MEDLSGDAIHLLKYFKDSGLGQAVYEVPHTLEGLFASPEDCEKAEMELAQHGLIELGPERHPADPSGVRAAALTRKGARYLQTIQ